MKYKDLKPVLADKIEEVVLTKDGIPTVTCTPIDISAEDTLLNEIFEIDVFSNLADFEVKNVFSTSNGFSLEFEYSQEISEALISKNINRILVFESNVE